MPRRAIHPGLVAGVDIESRPAAPAFSSGNQFTFDYALGAQGDSDIAIESLRGLRHKDASAAAERCQHLRPADDLRKMWRTDLFFTLGDQDEVDGARAAGAANCVQRCEKRGFGSFLVDG